MNARLRKAGRRSMALVVTLVLVTLTSALVVAFTMRARLDLAAATSYAAVPQADGIARGGVEFLVGWLRREIRDGSQAYGTSGGEPAPGAPAAYAPLDEANILPRRTLDRSGGDNPYYQSLLKISKRGKQFYESGGGWQFKGGANFDFPSDVSTRDGSVNGRQFGAQRWTASKLLTRDEARDFDEQSAKEDSLPDWIYVSREGPKRVAQVEEKQRDEDPENVEFVLGRFAYAVYDTSGLLDISVAGYPGTLESYYDGKGVSSKSSLAWVDPSGIQDPPGSVGVDRDKLVAWRNRASQGDFLSYVTNAAKEGFLTNAPGDNGFFSRSDLIEFAKSRDGSKIVNTNALANLTVFSREKNAPSWAPKNYDDITEEGWAQNVTVKYGDKAYEDGTTNRWAAGVLVSSAFTAPAPGRREFNTTVPEAIRFNEGDPLLKRRFPLSRIDLLRQNSGADRALIQYYFGLVPSGQNQGPVTIWQYRPYGTGGGGSGESQEMYTLDTIAGQGREPNFFELIAAGVLQGSLGKTGQQKNTNNNWEERAIEYRLGRDKSTFHQIIQIGANIIDQYDSDDWPTIIRSRVAKDENQDIGRYYANDLVNTYSASIRGVENNPYISMICSTVIRDISKGPPPGDWSSYNYPYAELSVSPVDTDQRMAWQRNAEPNAHPWVAQFLHFQMWNPNRNCGEAQAGDYRIAVQMGNTHLRPPRGLNGNDVGIPLSTDRFPGSWATCDPSTYRYIHGYKVDYEIFRETLYARYGRDFRQNPATIEFSTSSGGQMFQQPRLLRFGDSACPIKVGNGLDVFTVQGASMAGIRLGDTVIMTNLDQDKTNKWDFTYVVDVNNDGVPDVGTFGPQVYFSGTIPMVIELQKSIEGSWVTYYSLVPRKDGSVLNGFPRVDEHYYNWHDSQRLDCIYQRRWPILSRFCPISDPRCGRFGFTSGGGFDPTVGGSRRQQNWMKVGDRTLRYAPNYFWDLYKGTPQLSSERLDPQSGWWVTAWDAGPYKPLIKRASNGSSDQNPEGNSIKFDEDSLYYIDGDGNIRALVAPAELAENSQGQPRMGGDSTMWSIDRDELVRRGDGWRQRQINPYSMDDPTEPQNNIGRPIFLNRPFQSVAELGYVLRDDPWKTLNLFWNDSADAGLLDYFCLYEGEQFRPVVAGVVNPNTASEQVMKAIVKDTALYAAMEGVEVRRISDGTAEAIAKAIRSYLGDAKNPKKVLRSRGDLVEMCDALFQDEGVRSQVGNDAGVSGGGDTDTARESLARALVDVCNMRTWNLLLDVVAQSGRFTQASRGAADFLVTGERRLWVHLALDRFTGEVVDMDIEPVFE